MNINSPATGPILDLAEDLLGPDVRLHHSKLNSNWAAGGEEVKWHQDIQFWPHTNYSPLTIGVYLQGVTDEMAPMGVLPGSHNRKLYDLADSDGNWTGALNADDLERIDLDKVVWLKGTAGYDSFVSNDSRFIAERIYENATASTAYL